MLTEEYPITDIEIPATFNIGRACTQRFLTPEKMAALAIIVDDEERGYSALSYAELNDQSDQFGAALQGLGFARGDRLLIRLPNNLAYPVTFFGVLKIGGIAVPSSTQLSADELAFLLQDSAASVIVLEAGMLQGLAGVLAAARDLLHVIVTGTVCDIDTGTDTCLPAHCRLHYLDDLLQSAVPAIRYADTQANDPAYLVYTSGTTGYPKGVLHAHRALLGRTPAARYWFDYQGENDRILHSGKFNWTYVLGTGLMDPLYQGKSVVVHEGTTTPETWMRLVARYQCTIFIGVPTLFRQIIQKTPATAADVPSLRHCMSAGEHLSDELLAAWQARFQLDVFEAIGMSECSYYLSQSVHYPLRAGAAGRPQPGHRIALLDEHMKPVGTNEEGMLCIALDDPGLFLGYWQRPEEDLATRRDGYFLTGDYARCDEEGYIWFLGRRDDIINSFGYRISPHEVERVLKTHPAVADCVVVGEHAGPDKIIVTACVTLHEGLNHVDVTETELLAFALQHLARYKAPRKIVFMKTFPRTRNGKVLRKQIVRTLGAER
jgi:acetyl-CoA synthetase